MVHGTGGGKERGKGRLCDTSNDRRVSCFANVQNF